MEGKLVDAAIPEREEIVNGEISFVGSGNPSPSKYYVVPSSFSVAEFVKDFISKDIERPQVIISVAGGTQNFKMLPSNLEKIFNRGVLKAAENSRALIVTGGMSSGVMEFVGNALREMDIKVTCIGIATFSKVSHNETLEKGGKVNYSAEKKNDDISASLQQDHTHFVLVKSDVDDWGEEIRFRSDLEYYYATVENIPTVKVAVNGGFKTIDALVEAARRDIPVIVVEQSGRAADGIAAFIKHKDDNKRHKIDPWEKLFKSSEDMYLKEEYTILMNELCLHRDRISIFTPSLSAAEDMDKVILRSIMDLKDSSFYGKMELGVQWGRADLIEELLREEDCDTTSQEKSNAINMTLQQALLLDKPDIYELLVKKGANKDSIDLIELYQQQSMFTERLLPFAGVKANRKIIKHFRSYNMSLNNNYQEDNYQKIPEYSMFVAKQILFSVNKVYSRLFNDRQVTFTDALVWAILVHRPELAKAIWRNMDFPVHAALLACHLYSVLGDWFTGEEGYNDCRDWFEEKAIAVLSQANYEQAIPILRWKWSEMNDNDALQIAELSNCKEFTALPYVQRYLDKKQYYDENGHIAPGTAMWRVLLLVLCPFLIPFARVYKHKKGAGTFHFYQFYNLPVVKIVTSTLCYMAYLGLLTVNVIQTAPGRYDIEWYEICLWIFIFSSLIEEAVQYYADKDSYLEALSNQIDLLTHIGLVVYIILRLLSWKLRSDLLVEAYCNVIIVSNILCYIRLTTVFAVSKSLGPLFFVIIRLFKDVVRWLFIFLVFMVGFQIAFTALTRQADHNPWIFFPRGTLGVGLSTIIAQLGDNTLEWMQETVIGVGLLIVYSIISQIMLVNLLIAMMGDTYSTVKANADKEWKFYRYGLITEFTSTSSYPPPFNLVLGPIVYISYIFYPAAASEYHVQTPTTILHMKIARDKTIELENESERNSINALSNFMQESTRMSTNHANGDRLFLESNMKSLHKYIDESTKLHNQMYAAIQQLQFSFLSQERSIQSLSSKINSLSSSPISPPLSPSLSANKQLSLEEQNQIIMQKNNRGTATSNCISSELAGQC